MSKLIIHRGTQEIGGSAVEINNGETMVIGGLIESKIVNDVYEIPLLSKIPLVGKAFRSKTTNNSKTNLIILLTARIVDNNHKYTLSNNSTKEINGAKSLKKSQNVKDIALPIELYDKTNRIYDFPNENLNDDSLEPNKVNIQDRQNKTLETKDNFPQQNTKEKDLETKENYLNLIRQKIKEQSNSNDSISKESRTDDSQKQLHKEKSLGYKDNSSKQDTKVKVKEIKENSSQQIIRENIQKTEDNTSKPNTKEKVKEIKDKLSKQDVRENVKETEVNSSKPNTKEKVKEIKDKLSKQTVRENAKEKEVNSSKPNTKEKVKEIKDNSSQQVTEKKDELTSEPNIDDRIKQIKLKKKIKVDLKMTEDYKSLDNPSELNNILKANDNDTWKQDKSMLKMLDNNTDIKNLLEKADNLENIDIADKEVNEKSSYLSKDNTVYLQKKLEEIRKVNNHK